VLSRGDYLGGYQLDRITAEGVVMKNDEREISVAVPGPGALAAAAQPPGRAVPMPQRNMPVPGQQRQQLTAEQARQMVEILERARRDGATPQMLQAIQQLIQQRGIDSFENMDFVIQGGTMQIQRRPGGGQQERN
jgi:hypothetical protein